MKKVTSKHADALADAIIEMLKPFKVMVHSITADNGLEFADHERIAEELDTDVYFADPYVSYQREEKKMRMVYSVSTCQKVLICALQPTS